MVFLFCKNKEDQSKMHLNILMITVHFTRQNAAVCKSWCKRGGKHGGEHFAEQNATTHPTKRQTQSYKAPCVLCTIALLKIFLWKM